MDLFEAVSRRHSYRGGFEPTQIPRDDLRRIVQAGIQAPTGCNAQTTSFVIVDDPKLLHELAEIVDKPVVRAARAIIVCIVEHRVVYHGHSFGVEDCAAAVENILLAVTALGYATVWIDGALKLNGKAKKVAEILGVPDDREVRILLPIGIPTENWTQKEKKPFNERAWFNRFPSQL